MKIGKSFVVAIIIFFVVVGMIGFQSFKRYVAENIKRQQMMAPAVVEVEEIKDKSYNEESQAAGRIRAIYSVDVVARINGWLEKRFFNEGDYVKKGQALFKIEPREYNIAVQQAQAAARQAQATLVNAEKELKRAEELVKNDYVSKSYYDNALATRDQSKALYDMRKAELDNAIRNLNYTTIVSPIDGKIGKLHITEGNLVNQQTGKLATIVSNNPIDAEYPIKSKDYVKYKRMATSNIENQQVSVKLILADGEEYAHKGKIEFIDNVVNETTGTLQMRASFPNPDNILVPGDYVTVVLRVENPQVYRVVPQKAVLKSSDCSYVFVVNEVKDPKTGEVKAMASARIIEIDKPIGDNWIVLNGLDEGEKVIVSGLTNIRIAPLPNQKVGEKATEKSPQQPVRIDTKKDEQKEITK